MQLNILIFLAIAGLTYLVTVYLDNRHKPEVISAPVEVAEPVKTAEQAPDFSFTTQDRKTYKLSDFKGKVIVLNFWASWCPPCVKEFPMLLEVMQNYPEEAVLIALSSDLEKAHMVRFLKKQQKPGTNVFIALDEHQAITQKLYQTFNLPETLVITPDLNLHSKLVGADWDKGALEALIRAAKTDMP